MRDFKPWREQHRTAREYNALHCGRRIHLGRREFLVKWEALMRNVGVCSLIEEQCRRARWLPLEPTSSLPVNEEQLQQLIDLGWKG